MTGAGDNGRVTRADVLPEPAIDAVRRAALELLAALPEQPQRLRVRAGGVTVELDWRAGHTTAVQAVNGGQAVVQPIQSADRVELTVAAPEPAEPALRYLCAPSVGTFYLAPEPGAAPFVVEGAVVNPGQQVGIVEAMKLMVPVEADAAGRVVRVLVADGQSVEYGERLLALDPAQN